MFIIFQKLVPQHLLSRFVGLLAKSHFGPLKNLFIRIFAWWYKVDMSLAEQEDLTAYNSFNDFFTRKLKTGTRPVDDRPDRWVSPADGSLSQAAAINNGMLIQAKGHEYSVDSLLGDHSKAATYASGSFATIYLSPSDYHRVHMPRAGKLISHRYIPGKLFSVNQQTTNQIPGLFALNERWVCHFESEAGPFCVVMVGAMIVAAVQPAWETQCFQSRTPLFRTLDRPLTFNRGDELGCFQLGSTVILLS
ncbi:MAG: archaetidylserine decarboxylase, partial [Gammaproteobacteria bacterium]|nr:archaetidylserine decarboxylase [Gammaproteobacteria bacterium]